VHAAMLQRVATLLATCALIGCGADEYDDDPTADDFAELDELNGGKADGDEWLAVGNGVAYKRVNTGNAVLIAYGGYSARLVYSAAWGTELVDAKLGAAGVGHIYAVKGPAQANYAAREIGNSKIRAHLATLDDDTTPIYAVAHSSGSFVAHELLQQLHNRGETETLARIFYANLDGGGSGLNQSIAGELGGLTFVYAKDPALSRGLSQNAGSALALGMAYSAHGQAFEVTVPNTGCANGAGWCLHDVVITHRPHNPQSYDLARDYVDFENRPVTTEYLDQFLAP
jgi:hypothetical protein